MSDLFKSTYNPDALSCITTRRRPPSAPARGQGSGAKCPGIWRGVPRRRLPSWAVSQSAREAGGGFPCPAGAPPAPVATRRRHPSAPPATGAARRPMGAPSAPHPTWTPLSIQRRRGRLQKGEGYIPLPHHVTPRPSQLKAAQSNKDYCGLTYVTTTRRCGSSPSEWVITSSLSTRARCMILRS